MCVRVYSLIAMLLVAFRNADRELDSVLQQGQRCVSEHAYEETVIRDIS